MGDDIRIPEGMMEVWTIERPKGKGVYIDDLKSTEEEAREEVNRRGKPWKTVRLIVPYEKREQNENTT